MRAQRIVASFSTLAQYGTYFFIHLFISISMSYKENKWSSRKGNALFSIMKQIFFIFLIMIFFFFFWGRSATGTFGYVFYYFDMKPI